MIEEFKDVLLQFFKANGIILKKDNIILLKYEEIKEYIIGIFETNLPNFEYYEIIYNSANEDFTINVYQKVKTGKATKNEE